jgi:hypothetical protein
MRQISWQHSVQLTFLRNRNNVKPPLDLCFQTSAHTEEQACKLTKKIISCVLNIHQKHWLFLMVFADLTMKFFHLATLSCLTVVDPDGNALVSRGLFVFEGNRRRPGVKKLLYFL